MIVNMLTHTCPHKPRGNIEWPYAITRLTAHSICGRMSDLVMWKYGHTWHQMSFLRPGVIKQHKASIGLYCICILFTWFKSTDLHGRIQKRIGQSKKTTFCTLRDMHTDTLTMTSAHINYSDNTRYNSETHSHLSSKKSCTKNAAFNLSA